MAVAESTPGRTSPTWLPPAEPTDRVVRGRDLRLWLEHPASEMLVRSAHLTQGPGLVGVRKRHIARLGVAFALLTACSSASADVADTELRSVIESDAVGFSGTAIPDSITERLAAHRVVLIGETHHLREHWEFVATLLSDLYDEGFRQLLIEAPHMAGWLLDDYVRGSTLAPHWTPPPFYVRRLSMIRDFNDSHADDPIRVRAIDANEDWYGGAHDFQLLMEWFVDTLPTSGPTGSILEINYADAEPSEQRQVIETLLGALAADRSDLVEAWGVDSYEQLTEIGAIELASIDVRAAREKDDNQGARMREDVIKRLASDRIDECACGTVINIGAHHAQKAHLMGTDQEWLGDHLTHARDAGEGSIVVVAVSSARTDLEPGAEGPPWNILESASPDNELRRLLAETLPEQNAFLPLDDPLFVDRTIAYNSEDVIYVTRLAEQFDAVLQYDLAHRMPVD